MRILIVTQHFLPSIGGAEVMLDRLATAWARWDHRVVVLTGRWSRAWPEREERHGYQVVRHPVARIRCAGTLYYWRVLRQWIERRHREFDIAYVSMLKHAAFTALGAGQRVGLPVVLRAEGAGSTGDVVWQGLSLGGIWVRQRCFQARAIVAPSEEIRNELVGTGYQADRVHFIPNGVPIPDKPWQSSETKGYRRQLGLPDRKTVVYTGRLHPDKGLPDLLHAVALLATGESPQVALVGDGPARQELLDLGARLGLRDRLVLPGRVADVAPWLRAADLYVLPSYQEGLSVALLEALALGVPTIASDIPANRGILSSADPPLFPPRNPSALAATLSRLLAAVNDARLAERRAAIAQRFSLDVVARDHLRLFDAMIRP